MWPRLEREREIESMHDVGSDGNTQIGSLGESEASGKAERREVRGSVRALSGG